MTRRELLMSCTAFVAAAGGWFVFESDSADIGQYLSNGELGDVYLWHVIVPRGGVLMLDLETVQQGAIAAKNDAGEPIRPVLSECGKVAWFCG